MGWDVRLRVRWHVVLSMGGDALRVGMNVRLRRDIILGMGRDTVLNMMGNIVLGMHWNAVLHSLDDRSRSGGRRAARLWRGVAGLIC